MQHTNQELRDLLASQGKSLSASERGTLAKVQQAETKSIMQQFELQKPPERIEAQLSAVDRALLGVPAVVNFIADVGNTLTTFTQAIIPASLPFLLVLLIFAEAERVRHGVLLFEAYDYLAYIVAYILVVGNAFVELAIQHRHTQAHYQRNTGYEFSLRLLAQRLAYVFGAGNAWQPREKSPALRLERLQRALTAAILFLAIGGSMRETIMTQGGNWRAGLVSIAVDSTLLELLTWLSGLVAAVVIVLLAQAIVAYAYSRAAEYYHELLDRKELASGEHNPELERWSQQRDSAIETARQQAERELLLKHLAKLDIDMRQLQERENRPFGAMPAGAVDPENMHPTPNGNGHIASVNTHDTL